MLAVGAALLPLTAAAQGLTGALVGTVKDEQGAALPGALVRLTSPALIGGPVTTKTDQRGQLRFPALLPGSYVLDVERPGFAQYHEEDIDIGGGATLSRTIELKVAGVAVSILNRAEDFEAMAADVFVGVGVTNTLILGKQRKSRTWESTL